MGLQRVRHDRTHTHSQSTAKETGAMEKKVNKWCWGRRTVSCKRMKLECSLTPYTKKSQSGLKT